METVTRSFVTMRNPRDRRNYMDFINSIINEFASNCLYEALEESNEINYDNDLEITLSSLYLDVVKNNELKNIYDFIINSEKKKSKPKTKVKDY